MNNGFSRNKDEIINMIGREQTDLDADFGYIGGLRRLEEISDWLLVKQEEMEGLQRIPRAVEEDVQFSTSSHPDEGPSSCHSNSSYGYSESSRTQTDQGGPGRILLEEDRAMLLRKLDELKEQLSRSCNVVDKPKEKASLDGSVVPPKSYGGADSWLPNGSSGSQKPPLPFYGPDKHAATAGPSYFSHFPEPFTYPVGNKLTRHGLHPPMHNPNPVPAYGTRMLGRTSHQLPGEYLQQPPHPYFSRQYNGSNQDPFMPYLRSSVLNHSSCSCFNCYEKHQRVSAPIPPSAYGNRGIPDMPSNPMYHIENPGTSSSHFNNSRTAMLPLSNVHGTQAHARVVLGSGGRRLRPIAGGAPFLTCSNCFELLQMPRKLQLMVKNENKLCCGACSTVINFTLNKRLVLHDHAKTKETSVEADDISNEVVNDCSSHFHGHVNRVSSNFSSDDYDHSGYELQSMDREPVAMSTGQASNSVKPHEMQIVHSSSPSISEDENSQNILIASREEVDFVQQPTKSILPPPAGSPLQEHFDYSTNNRAVNQSRKGTHSSHSDHDNIESNKAPTCQSSVNEASLPIEIEVLSHEYSNTGISRDSKEATREDNQPKMANNRAVNRFGKGNRSGHSDHDNVVSNKARTRQNSLNEASFPTEIEVLSNEYSDTEISRDSEDATREDNRSKMAKGGEPFFPNIINKNFKDSSKFIQTEEHGKSNVSVNGHELPDLVVKKAEKMAGRIQPGQYWYDFRAGFWGVLGGPCLGIIRPSIEEFNYPMPENCAGGTTGVIVNGRELHQKDLEILAKRGLPTDRDRSYIIDISGKVLDVDTGEELHKLGKLAPTVEKAKHGFGMKVRRSAAQ